MLVSDSLAWSILVASGSVIGALTVEFILQAPDNSPIRNRV